jgi:hypothetical protein
MLADSVEPPICRYSVTVAPAALVDALQDRYVLERELGRGGMATVYIARDVKHDREVALKLLRPELAAVLGAERFLQEIRISARLDHPHILTLIDSDESDGFVWYVLPYVRGESLRDKLTREKQLSIEEAVRIATQVASALDYAHRHGVIHRDIKPENILLHEGEAVVADFGIALAVREAGGPRVTETGLSLGTPQYMSPEQATGGRDLDARSDVYSLAAVVYEMLAGEPPHTGPTVQAVIAKLLTERPTRIRTVRDTVPEGIDSAVGKALAKVPADRFSSATEFVAALSGSDTTTRISPSRARRRIAKTWAPAAGLVVLGLIGVIYFHPARSAPSRRNYQRIQLTASGQAHTPVLSPDGSQVAYAARECPEGKACIWSVVVRETATGLERPILQGLADVYLNRWSPRGLWLLYSAKSPGGTYVVPRIGGPVSRLGLGPGDFLPAGDTVLVAGGWRAEKTIWMRRFALPSSQPLDSVAIKVPRTALGLRGTSVAPSGRWLALAWYDFTESGMISVHDRSGRLADSIAINSPYPLRWVPDGTALLVPLMPRVGPLTDGALLRIGVDPATGRLGRVDTLAIAPGSGSRPEYDLSADGRSLVYAVAREGESALWTLERTSTRALPRPFRQVRTSSRPFDAYLTRDGRSILYSAVTQAGTGEGIQWFLAPFDSGAARPVTPPIADPIGHTATDGRRLFIATRSPDGHGRLTAYDLATGRASPFAEEATDRFSIWSGTNGSIGVLSATGDSLRLLDSVGHELLRTGFTDSVGRVAMLASSPDGKELALFPFASPEPDAEGNFHGPLHRVSAITGRFRYVAQVWGGYAPERPFVWTDDGWIHFAMWSTASDPRPLLYRVRADGGDQEVEGALPFGRDAVCSMSGNGRRWACVVSRALSDLYLIRDFDPGRP